MLRPRALANALSRIKLVSEHGPWSRAISFRHMLGPPPGEKGPPQPLWGGASKLAGARFTPPASFDSIYLAGDPVTAFVEVSALITLPTGPHPIRSAPWVVISVGGIVSQVLDLTKPEILTALGTNEQEISGPWLRSRQPPTQVLAQVAYCGPVAAIKYPSAKHPGGTNLVVFPDRLVQNPTDYLETYDPYGQLAQRIEGRKPASKTPGRGS